MRVIAGTARSIPLEAPKGADTRPTTDRIKETLFNMLQTEIPGSVFIDFFSGSGAIAIEALSRGAEKAVLIEHGREAGECIRKNLEKCRFTDRALLMKTDALAAVSRVGACLVPERRTVWFMDPPYDRGLELQVLRALCELELIREEDTVVIERSLLEDSMKAFTEEAGMLGFRIERDKKYKNQRHVFLRKGGSDDGSLSREL